MEAKMSFNLKVTETEINKTLKVLEDYVYPASISLEDLFIEVYERTYPDVVILCEPDDIEKRKVRVCIQERTV